MVLAQRVEGGGEVLDRDRHVRRAPRQGLRGHPLPPARPGACRTAADCQLNIGFMRTIGAPLRHAAARRRAPRVPGARRARVRVRRALDQGKRRRHRAHDAVLVDQVDVLEAQLAFLQSTTADLVSSDDIDEVLARIVTSAGRVGERARLPARALRHRRGHRPRPRRRHRRRRPRPRRRPRCSTARSASARRGSSSRSRRAARSTAASPRSTTTTRSSTFEEGLLAAYAQSAAAALDAATALDQARRRGAATAALLRLARSLSEPAGPRRIARIVAGAMTEILDVPATAVLLWNDDGRAPGRGPFGLAVRGRARSSTGSSSRPRTFRNLAALLETEGARIVHARRVVAPNPIVADARRRSASRRSRSRRSGRSTATSSGSPSRR